MTQILLQGMTNIARFAFTVGDTDDARGLQLVLSKTNRIGILK
jgi:hypothetical protein